MRLLLKRPISVGLVVGALLLSLTQAVTYQRYLITKEAKKQKINYELAAVKFRVTAALNHSFSALKTLAFIVTDYGVPNYFDSVAQHILRSCKYIDALQLTRKGVITHVYPLQGNEAAIGFDILTDPLRKQEAYRALQKRDIFFAGPFELKQGGMGIVGRLPIFFKNDQFEGFAAVVIKLSTLEKVMQLDTLPREFVYQISKVNPITRKEEYFLSTDYDIVQREFVGIHLPEGDWKIMVAIDDQHGSLFSNLAFPLVGLLFSFTGGLFAWHLTRQPAILKELVDKKTALVIDSQNQFKTTLDRVSDGFISYDREWRYRYMNGEAEQLLGLKFDEVIGKNIWEEFPELIAQPIHDAYLKAIADQQYVFIESYLPEQDKWFENHLYPAVDGLSVFFRDVTQQKAIQEEIIKAYKEKEAVFQRISDSVISVDNEWRYTFLNDTALAEHPLGRAGTLGKVIWDVHPEMLGTVFWENYHKAKNTGQPVEFESFYAPMSIWFSVKVYPSDNGLTVFYKNVSERKQAEQAIRESEARLLEAQEVAKVGSWQTDLVTLKVVWSLQTYHIFQLDPATFKPMHTTFLDLVHPHDQDKVKKAFTESFTCTDSCVIEHRIITPGGQEKWVEERWRVFQNELHKPYRAAGTCQDITERKIAEIEKALLINNTEESFILLDVNLKIVSFNSQFFTLYSTYFDLTVEKNKSILDYVKSERREALTKIYNTVLGGKTEQEEASFELPGHPFKIFSIKYKPAKNEADEIIGVFVTCSDITERKEAETQIQNEKVFSDFLINSLPGIFYLYDEHGRFSRWNKNFETISGYQAAEISLMHPLDFYDGDEKNLMKTKIEKVFSDGNEEVAAHFYTKDKKKIPYYFNGHKISLNGNDYLIGLGIDITERTRAEQELIAYTKEIKKLTAHLEQVREEERTRIAREIHDELGQQLTGLKMDASWLSKKIGRQETSVHEKLSSMILLMEHTVKTIRRIASDLRPGILDDLGLVAALEWQSTEFEKRTETRCIFKSEVENLNVDWHLATGVFRIYQETLTNVMRHAKATRVEASLTKTKTHIVLSVEDNGRGFDTNTKSKESLGLLGMRERASMLGITLDIISEIGSGTCVSLKIPLSLDTQSVPS